MTLQDCFVGKRVAYRTTEQLPDRRQVTRFAWGRVSSTNETYVFVRFDEAVARHGWDGTTRQACRPEDLFDAATCNTAQE